jgi:hypothetical protein
MPKAQLEYQLQVQIADYLRSQYPNALFLSDTVASVKLTMPQAVRNKRVQNSNFKCPDLIILEIRQKEDFVPTEKPGFTVSYPKFAGLFIELKKETPYKLNGEIKSSQDNHLKLQWESILKLRERGYYADWCWTWESAKQLIDWYLK